MSLNPRVPTSMDLDLAVQQNHPVLREEGQEEEEVDTLLPLPSVQEDLPQESDEDSSDTEEDVFAQSS